MKKQRRRGRVLWLVGMCCALGPPAWAAPVGLKDVTVRGKRQTVRLYGTPTGTPAVLASGDGGWIHLAPEVAELLAARGHYVVGLDSKAYLASFTERGKTLTVQDVPDDVAVFLQEARAGRQGPVLLAGISEGAGLMALAATKKQLQGGIAGVLTFGMPEENELGWRFRDSIIYITKKTPNEPLFRASEWVAKLAPVPLAAIYSTHDEFVPLEEGRRVVSAAGEPKRLWVVEAENHRFSGDAAGLAHALDEALAWIDSQSSR